MVKFILWVVFLAVAFVVYDDGIKPYYDALAETKSIYESLGVVEGQQGTDANRPKVIEALKKQCKHGFTQASIYDFRCASDSLLPFID